MQPEIEAKFYPIDLDVMRQKLTQIGAVCQAPMRLMRRIVFSNRHNPAMQATYIRVRDECNLVALSAKKYIARDTQSADQHETQVQVSDFATTVQILKLAGLTQSACQETKRETWVYKNSHIELDIWPGLEPFVEIESPNTSELNAIAQELSLKDGKSQAVVPIYQKVYGLTRDQVHELIDNLSFEHNPFENLPKQTP